MKSPIPVLCSCGKQISLQIVGSQLPEYVHCPNCQASIYLVPPLGNIVTALIMERARQELANEDTTIAILLSAMAVEGEMAYLFFKWKEIDSGRLPFGRTQDEEVEWERAWADMRSVGKRLDELCRFLTSADFDKFALQNKELLSSALGGCDPADSLKKFFQEQLFEKRNQIVHYSRIDFEKAKGERCVSLASALIRLLDAMNRDRVKRMDDAHEKANEAIRE